MYSTHAITIAIMTILTATNSGEGKDSDSKNYHIIKFNCFVYNNNNKITRYIWSTKRNKKLKENIPEEVKILELWNTNLKQLTSFCLLMT